MNKRQVNHLMTVGRKAVLAVYEGLREYDYQLLKYFSYNNKNPYASVYFDMEFSNGSQLDPKKCTFKLKLEDDTITYLELVQ